MILERKSQFNIPDLKEQQGMLFRQIIQQSDTANLEESLRELAELIHLYSAAMKEISTKLEVLDDEFQIGKKHNPIHHIECRLKAIPSIYEKMQRYGVALSLNSAREHIQDIAGIRVVCNFIDDIYAIEKMLLKQSDITFVKRKDYIADPKPNGYRCLHLIVKVPVFLSEKREIVPVEIQLRTIAMDYWASLEHMLKYKNDEQDIERYVELLKECSNTLADTEKTMQYIRENIEGYDEISIERGTKT